MLNLSNAPLSILDLNFSGFSKISGAWIENLLSNLHVLHPSSLPKVVKRRIKALKNYQVSHTKLEAKFYEEVHQLECKYAKLYEGLYDKVSISSQESIFQFRFQDFLNEKGQLYQWTVQGRVLRAGIHAKPNGAKKADLKNNNRHYKCICIFHLICKTAKFKLEKK